MSTELSADQYRILEHLVAQGRFSSPQHALDRAVKLLCEESETIEAIREDLASIERGEGASLEDVAHDLRAKYNIPEDA